MTNWDLVWPIQKLTPYVTWKILLYKLLSEFLLILEIFIYYFVFLFVAVFHVIQLCRSLAKGTLKVNRTKPLMQRIQNFIFSKEFGRNFVLKKAREGVMKQTSGLYPAPLKILKVVETGLADGSVAGYNAEAEVSGLNCGFC